VVVLCLSTVLGAGRAAALPRYSCQTGLPCPQCHVQGFGPDLTDFGRQFKLHGYVWGDRPDVPFIPLAAMLQTSFTHTGQGQPGGATPHFKDNNNVALDQLSLFYAGRIVPHVGAFVQGTYDGVTGTAALDNVDIRAAMQGTVLGTDLIYGVSVNNTPTVQDLWNTTPARGFPCASSRLAPTPASAWWLTLHNLRGRGKDHACHLDGRATALTPGQRRNRMIPLRATRAPQRYGRITS
jgi:hypothetical protein